MASGLVFVAGVGAADFWTGSELSFSLFYLIPVVFVTWFAGRASGVAIGVASAMTWWAADFLAGQSYSQPIIGYWNAAVRLGFFVAVTLLLPALKERELAREVARVDYLTGILNRRSFFEVLQKELDRSRRYARPFSVAYLDLDAFKTVNDRLGHQVGDRLLCAVVDRANTCLRKTDTIARLGGDEFVLLLPETDQEAALTLIARIQSALLDEMKRNGWPVTFSIGVLTSRVANISADDLVAKADEVMYSVKKRGKNAVASAVYAG